MEEMGCSAITNPFSAMMITSIVQVTLIAAQNQIHKKGYMSCSVTTDGFISNCPEEELNALDLYGMKKYLEEARIFLTSEPDIWEIKHIQNDLVNFTTRGNVSLYCKNENNVRDFGIDNSYIYNGKEYPGVCAHNSAKSGLVNDSYEDRLWLMTKVLERVGPVVCKDEKWTSFKDLVDGKPFITTTKTRKIHQDFDMKRKPDRDSFYTDRPIVEGVEYKIAHFSTVPFEDVDEFILYRKNLNL